MKTENANQTPAEAALKQAREALAAANDTAARLPGSIASLKAQLTEALVTTFAGRKPARSVAGICSEITEAGLTSEVMPKVIRLLEVEEREVFDKVRAERDLETKRREMDRYLALRSEAIGMGTAGKVPTGGFLDMLAGAGRVAGRRAEAERLLACFDYLVERRGRYNQKDARLLTGADTVSSGQRLQFRTDEEVAAAGGFLPHEH
jgi:hypothetical protein